MATSPTNPPPLVAPPLSPSPPFSSSPSSSSSIPPALFSSTPPPSSLLRSKWRSYTLADAATFVAAKGKGAGHEIGTVIVCALYNIRYSEAFFHRSAQYLNGACRIKVKFFGLEIAVVISVCKRFKNEVMQLQVPIQGVAPFRTALRNLNRVKDQGGRNMMLQQFGGVNAIGFYKLCKVHQVM
ncbi:uncharacterized protein A4U43_C04F23040 [Asparagus officinalis]|uniref:Uncharacterized protein n=1 Tax=Asparagus officinalis TaxID=4686 RepID=A0A5P1F7Z1_ASPOF|nr:uncharacterized protein A4U43_C04F23040 [Asparagus officinalis]